MTVLYNGIIVTMNSKMEIHDRGWIEIDDSGAISDVGAGEPPSKDRDLRGNMIIPALVNGHTHSAMTLLRGYADDLALKDWLEKHIWPAEGKLMNEENINAGLELAMLEMLRCGTGTFCDMYFFSGSELKTVERAGMRGLMAEGIIDFPTPNSKNGDEAFKYVKKVIEENDTKTAMPVLSVHAPNTTSPELIEKTAQFAKEKDMLFVTHTAETQNEVEEIKKRFNKTPVEHLASLIPQGTKTAMAHMVHLTDNDMETASRRHFNAVHNPQSNLKLSSGIARIQAMRDAGIKVSIGTDGAASNNNLDMIEEMRTASMIGKGASPLHVSAEDIMKMATIEGARVLGLGEMTGSLEKGKKADIAEIDMNGLEAVPYYDNPYSFIVYALNSRDIKMTMVNGRVLYNEGEYETLNKNEIIDRVRTISRGIK